MTDRLGVSDLLQPLKISSMGFCLMSMNNKLFLFPRPPFVTESFPSMLSPVVNVLVLSSTLRPEIDPEEKC
jgi:hypothetical protein